MRQLSGGGLRPVPVLFGDIRDRPALPGGRSGYCVAIWGDPNDGTWWVDGYDIRRTIRTATPEEVRDLVRVAQPTSPGMIPLPRDPRFTAMLETIGVKEP
jgi:hypothetical protein